jgi:mRNA-degrading endonuclease RelE of RelBE toxin-antitoxin system
LNEKRPNESGLAIEHEPEVQKKSKLADSEKKEILDDKSKGKSKELSDEDDDYEKDSLIEDGNDEDPVEEARRELEEMMGRYRKKIQSFVDEKGSNPEEEASRKEKKL